MKLRKILLLLTVVAVLVTVFTMSVSAAPLDGVNAAHGVFNSFAMAVLTNFVVPTLLVASLVVLVVLIFMLVGKHRQGEEYKGTAIGIGITLVVMALLGAFQLWGPAFLTPSGTQGGTGGATTTPSTSGGAVTTSIVVSMPEEAGLSGFII